RPVSRGASFVERPFLVSDPFEADRRDPSRKRLSGGVFRCKAGRMPSCNASTWLVSQFVSEYLGQHATPRGRGPQQSWRREWATAQESPARVVARSPHPCTRGRWLTSAQPATQSPA